MSREKTVSAQEPRRLKTREALMTAGAELLSRESIDAISVNEIVDAAGVAKGSFFNHFADKEAFAAAIAREIRAAVEADVTAANAEVSDPAQRVARAMSGFIQFALTHPKRARIMLRAMQGAVAADHPLNRGIRHDIEQGVATARFRARAREAGIAYVVGVCQMAMSFAATRNIRHADAQRLAADILVLALGGLGIAESEADAIAASAVREIIVGRAG